MAHDDEGRRRAAQREQAGHESEAEARRAARPGESAEGIERGAPRSAEDLAVEAANARKADERKRKP
jgi:hypothetical protein